jgi:hypothetical protein
MIPRIIGCCALITDQDRIVGREVLDHIIPHNIPQPVGVPAATAQNSLLPPRPGITGRLSAHPACLATLVTQ